MKPLCLRKRGRWPPLYGNSLSLWEIGCQVRIICSKQLLPYWSTRITVIARFPLAAFRFSKRKGVNRIPSYAVSHWLGVLQKAAFEPCQWSDSFLYPYNATLGFRFIRNSMSSYPEKGPGDTPTKAYGVGNLFVQDTLKSSPVSMVVLSTEIMDRSSSMGSLIFSQDWFRL